MPYDDLDRLLEHIWNYIEAAVIVRANAMTTPAFATTGPDGPSVRTIALRKANRAERTLLFHTDVRSKKVQELEHDKRAVWMGWDADISEQFQLLGPTTIHRKDEVVRSLWNTCPRDEKEFYFKPLAPGEPADGPGSGIRLDELDETEARQNFAVVRTLVEEIKWLYVGDTPDNERQALFKWDGDAFRGQWVVP